MGAHRSLSPIDGRQPARITLPPEGLSLPDRYKFSRPLGGARTRVEERDAEVGHVRAALAVAWWRKSNRPTMNAKCLLERCFISGVLGPAVQEA